MQLRKVFIDAYKSIIKSELEITDSCIGLVGINESGKSNILNAIASLSPSKPLTISDTPKISKENPSIRFEFELNDTEKTKFVEILKIHFGDQYDIENILQNDYRAIYKVTFDRKKLVENRSFLIENIVLPKDMLILKTDILTEELKIKIENNYVPIDKVLLIKNRDIKINEDLFSKSEELFLVNEQIADIQSKIKNLEEIDNKTEINKDEGLVNNTSNEINNVNDSFDIKQYKNELTKLEVKKIEIQKLLGDYNLKQKKSTIEEKISETEASIKQINNDIMTTKTKIDNLKTIDTLTDDQQNELNLLNKNLTSFQSKIEKNISLKKTLENTLDILCKPLSDLYTQSTENLSFRLGKILEDVISELIPAVVIWKYNEEYILKGETEFDTIKRSKSLDEISRPLINLFRIALNIDSMEKLLIVIAEIQNDPSERRRYESTLDEKINKYIKSVWEDYNQKIKISLEKERILVQFYDPDCDGASYFEMQERSQGCQTFISFLLTIGAEAKQGIIRDTILLLDEPETHLHPSGVRYMLQELIKAAKNGNKVIFATHSIFMIDRDYYNRHAIVSKQKELTHIQPSSHDRIGFFMQEEVLYSALDINLKKDFESSNKYNFVFEGDGDATLFKNLYSKLLKSDQVFSFETTSFYQGGKCSDIQKYFENRPIQLGSYWVFILDKDEPANKLKSFIEGKYKIFINKYIFIFQYDKEDSKKKEIEIEFEDLLPESIIKKAIELTTNILKIENKENLFCLIGDNKGYKTYFTEILSLVSDENKQIFKETFKSQLNKIVSNTKKNKKEFEECYPEYFSWTIKIIENIKSNCNTK